MLPAETSIYLLRHGQTQWNVKGRYQGGLDSPLTEKGKQQARDSGRKLARHLNNASRCQIVSSPQGRALHTAELVALELGCDPQCVQTDPRLKEISFGEWEGKTMDEIKREYPDEFVARTNDRWRVAPPQGESYSGVATRLKSWSHDLVVSGHCIVVSHGCTGRILRGLIGDLSLQEISSLDEAHENIYRLSNESCELL
ncbi:MAG: histidine phosphatase family protein [Pseudomonadota bacterium]